MPIVAEVAGKKLDRKQLRSALQKLRKGRSVEGVRNRSASRSRKGGFLQRLVSDPSVRGLRQKFLKAKDLSDQRKGEDGGLDALRKSVISFGEKSGEVAGKINKTLLDSLLLKGLRKASAAGAKKDDGKGKESAQLKALRRLRKK